MLEEDEEGEYLDDPISLTFNGSADIVDLATSSSSDDEEEAPAPRSSYGNKSFCLPVTFFDMPRNVKLLKECKPLSIKVIDYGKYPAHKHIRQAKSQVSCDKNMQSYDDHKLKKAVMETMSVNVGLDSKVDSEKPNAETNLNPTVKVSCGSRTEESDREAKAATKKNNMIGSEKMKHEKQQALKHKDSSRVDFKKNTGLVGLTISNELAIKIDLNNKRSKKEKERNDIMKDIDATLNKLGTEVIPLSNRNLSDVPKNVINDSQSNIPPKEVSFDLTDAKDQISKNYKNSPTRCSLKIKCAKLLEKAIKLKEAKESHNKDSPKTKFQLGSKPNTSDIIANDHTVPKLNLKRRQSEADRNVFYIVDSKNKESSCDTETKTRKLEQTQEVDKTVENDTTNDIPARSKSPILRCTTNINTSNKSKLKTTTKLSNKPTNNREETVCALPSKSETKSYQKKLQSYIIRKNTPKKKIQSKPSNSECSNVPVNNKKSREGLSAVSVPKPDELAGTQRKTQVHLNKINWDKIIRHSEILSGAENSFCVRSPPQITKTKVTSPTDAVIVNSENLISADKDSCVRFYQHMPKVKVSTPTDTTNANENRVQCRDTTPKIANIVHKQKDAETALNLSQNVKHLSSLGENYRTKEWRRSPVNTQPDMNKAEKYPILNKLFYSNHPGIFKQPQHYPLQSSMHQIQGHPFKTMINGISHLYRQPERIAHQGRPVRCPSPWPLSSFLPPNTNIAPNGVPRMQRPNSQICKMSYGNTSSFQIPTYSWPIMPGNRCLLPTPSPLPHQQENGSSLKSVRQVPKECIIGSDIDGKVIKKIMLANTRNDKEKMLETLNYTIEENVDKVTEKKQEPMRTQTDPRLTDKSKPCPLSKKGNNYSFQQKIDEETRDVPTSKVHSPCNVPVPLYQQAFGIINKNVISCPLSKKPINSVQSTIDQRTRAVSSYSLPILPIPSYQQVFETIAKHEKQKVHDVFKTLKTFTNNSELKLSKITKKKGSREDQAKKISIEEYKNRIKGKDSSVKRKCKNKNLPNNVAVDNNQDLGYDSDATYVL